MRVFFFSVITFRTIFHRCNYQFLSTLKIFFSKEITIWVINMNNILQKKKQLYRMRKRVELGTTLPSFYIKKKKKLSFFLIHTKEIYLFSLNLRDLGGCWIFSQEEPHVILSYKLNFTFCQNTLKSDFICLFQTHSLLDFSQDFCDIAPLTDSLLSSALSVSSVTRISLLVMNCR